MNSIWDFGTCLFLVAFRNLNIHINLNRTDHTLDHSHFNFATKGLKNLGEVGSQGEGGGGRKDYGKFAGSWVGG